MHNLCFVETDYTSPEVFGQLAENAFTCESYSSRSATSCARCNTRIFFPCASTPPRMCIRQPGLSATRMVAPVLSALRNLLCEQAFRYVAVFDGGRAAEAAAHVGLRHLAQFQPQRVPDDVTRFFAQSQAVARLAGVVIGGDDLCFAIILAHRKLNAICQHSLQKTGEVHHFVRQFPRASQPALLVAGLQRV